MSEFYTLLYQISPSISKECITKNINFYFTLLLGGGFFLFPVGTNKLCDVLHRNSSFWFDQAKTVLLLIGWNFKKKSSLKVQSQIICNYGKYEWYIWDFLQRFLMSHCPCENLMAMGNSNFRNSETTILFYTPAPRRGRGVYCFTSVRPSKIYFVAFFSETVDGRNLIFGHKCHIGIPYCG